MSYDENTQNAVEKIISLASIRPRRRLSDWIVNADFANVYQIAWAERFTVGLYDQSLDGSAKVNTLAACAANEDSWYHDVDAGILYFNPDATDPTTNVVVVEWDMLFCGEPLNWYYDPRDSASGDAVWSGGLIKPPIPTQGNPDLLFGFSPVNLTTLQIQLADGAFLEHLHEWSLKESRIKVWQCAGDLDTENISEIFVGVGGNIALSGGILTIEVADPLQILDKDVEGESFSPVDFGFSTLEPSADGWPIRKVFGWINYFLPVNIDYDATPSTTNNRDWVVDKGAIANAGTLPTRTVVVASLNNTATQTEVNDASGINVGDTVVIEDNGTPKYAGVATVNYTTNVFTHSSIGARTPTAGDEVDRGFVGAISILVNDVPFSPMFGRDYLCMNFANDTRGFRLTDNFEASLAGFPATFEPSSMPISCRVYGNKMLPKKYDGVTDFGAVSDYGYAISNPVTILWDFLLNYVPGFSDRVTLDEDAWSALALDFDRPIGIAIPETKTGDFPTWKEVFQRLLQTEILKMHFKILDGESLLTITQPNPSVGGATEATDDEIASPTYEWNYSDIYSTIFTTIHQGENISLTITQTSDIAAYLHRSGKSIQIDTLFNQLVDLAIVSNRLTALLGERRGTIQAALPISFIGKSIDDELQVKSKRLPGFTLSAEINERPYKILQHSKSANGLAVSLDDQKGVEDAGGW